MVRVLAKFGIQIVIIERDIRRDEKSIISILQADIHTQHVSRWCAFW